MSQAIGTTTRSVPLATRAVTHSTAARTGTPMGPSSSTRAFHRSSTHTLKARESRQSAKSRSSWSAEVASEKIQKIST